jgi:hypothetical protein
MVTRSKYTLIARLCNNNPLPLPGVALLFDLGSSLSITPRRVEIGNFYFHFPPALTQLPLRPPPMMDAWKGFKQSREL